MAQEQVNIQIPETSDLLPAAARGPAPCEIETGDTFEFMVRALREGAVTPEGLRSEADHAIRFFIGMSERPIFSGTGEPAHREIADQDKSYEMHVLGKIWGILADGERAIDPDSDPEFDTNDMYDLVRAGVDARKNLAKIGGGE